MVRSAMDSRLKQCATNLRENMTDEERKLWYLFLHRYPVRFRRQYLINGFIADFYCNAAKLVIELDGSQHYSDFGKAHPLAYQRMLSAVRCLPPSFAVKV